VKDNVVSYNGRSYKAKWWTTNETPGTTGEWGVWTDLGPC
jgi:chitinase